MAFTNRQGRTETVLSEINMVPFIDIVLVLLIIFMVTAPVIQSGIEVNVPKTELVRELSEEKLVISIDREERLFLQNDAININEVGAKIQERLLDPSRQSVYLRADEAVRFGAVAVVMDRLRAAGVTNISVVTEPINPKRNR